MLEEAEIKIIDKIIEEAEEELAKGQQDGGKKCGSNEKK